MKIKKGSKVKVVCTNNLVEGGVLVEYSEDQLVLELIDKSYVIIQNPKQNVILIKVFKAEDASNAEEQIFIDKDLEPEKYERREDLRVKDLAELHKLRANEERKRARELLTSFTHKKSPEVTFGYPSFQSVPKHPKKKTR